jgi:acyl carrier protein
MNINNLVSQEARAQNEYVAPRDETERILCRIWSEILGLDSIGIDDDFFTVGGHSLLAAKLFARLDEELNWSLPLSVLFAARTVRELAARFETSKECQRFSVLVELTSGGNLTPIYAMPGIYGNTLGYAELARELGRQQPFFALEAVGLSGAEAPIECIEHLAKRYISEIRSVQPHGPYVLVGACFGATVAYEIARQFLDAGEEVRFFGLLDPTRHEGYEVNKNGAAIPRIVKRAHVLGTFLRGRLRLYLNEMKELTVTPLIASSL